MDGTVSELSATDKELGEEALLSITQQETFNDIRPVARTLWEMLDPGCMAGGSL